MSTRIQILPEHVYQKIAAGEVIDRPASVLRELIENAVDAESTSVDVYISEGGMEEIRVIDDGNGMSKEDLALSVLPHATSKVKYLDDLQTISTLGFRGEALASIAASSKCEIISSTDTTGKGHRVVVENGTVIKSETARSKKGTTVIVRELFYSIPVRKQFLKSPATEQKMCRQVFVEKAFPFTDIAFRFFADEKQQINCLPSSLIDRGGTLFSRHIDTQWLMERTYSEKSGLIITCLLGYPETYRKDRRFIYIYVNNRRIDEYGLVQAVEYGYGDFLPGGRFPYAFIFITLPPGTVDFNIHPAKKEIRITNMQSLHRTLHQFVRSSLLEQCGTEPHSQTENSTIETEITKKNGKQIEVTEPELYQLPPARSDSAVSVHDRSVQNEKNEIMYLGQIFSLFLVAAADNSLYIIDQHAAHERYLYDSFTACNIEIQSLLVPVSFETEVATSGLIRSNLDTYRQVGIMLQEEEKNRWLLTSIPALPGIRKEDIVDFLRTNTEEEDLRKALFARLACKAAVKDGEVLDTASAFDLVQKAFALSLPRCPHGRPVWHKITRSALFTLVGRKI